MTGRTSLRYIQVTCVLITSTYVFLHVILANFETPGNKCRLRLVHIAIVDMSSEVNGSFRESLPFGVLYTLYGRQVLRFFDLLEPIFVQSQSPHCLVANMYVVRLDFDIEAVSI